NSNGTRYFATQRPMSWPAYFILFAQMTVVGTFPTLFMRLSRCIGHRRNSAPVRLLRAGSWVRARYVYGLTKSKKKSTSCGMVPSHSSCVLAAVSATRYVFDYVRHLAKPNRDDRHQMSQGGREPG